jgi:hypothetical protein
LFPAAAAFGADVLEEFACGFDARVGSAPVGGQIAAEGGGQHRLAELLQQRPHSRKRHTRAPTPLLQRFNLRYNPSLLGCRGNSDRYASAKELGRNTRLIDVFLTVVAEVAL